MAGDRSYAASGAEFASVFVRGAATLLRDEEMFDCAVLELLDKAAEYINDARGELLVLIKEAIERRGG